jgi:very-short-patch-repair endonuclease
MGDDRPFIGSAALATGVLTRHRLRTGYRALMPDVYLDKRVPPSLLQRTIAAWLWSGREATIAGAAAAALHGAKWVDDTAPVELIWRNARRPAGVVTRADLLLPGETQCIDGMDVTTPERTAFDLGRRSSLDQAVAQLDALAAATGFTATNVLALARHHRRAKGLRQLDDAVRLMDPGAESPRETWLRLVLIRAGFPRPQTQIPVRGYRLDMGWEHVQLAVEYDGDDHRTNRSRYVRDIRRIEEIRRLGWTHIRVVAENTEASIVRWVSEAWDQLTLRPGR